jgi:hypothetical protein
MNGAITASVLRNTAAAAKSPVKTEYSRGISINPASALIAAPV